MNELVSTSRTPLAQLKLPRIITEAGPQAEEHFVEFFAATIRNPNTRAAYVHAVKRFLDWVEAHDGTLHQIRPLIVSSYIEMLCGEVSPPTVKQHLAALKGLFDYLVVKQVVSFNPASSVRGPKHNPKEGKTPIMEPHELRQLFAAIDRSNVRGLRDDALLKTMLFSLARVSAVIGLRVKDFRDKGATAYFYFREKGGKTKTVPVHHVAHEAIDTYLEAAGIREQKDAPIFQSTLKSLPNHLTGRGISRTTALLTVKRYVHKAGLDPEICNHSFRGSGITIFLEEGGDLDTAADLAGHASTSTTRLYDRTNRQIKRRDIERIRL